MKPRWQRAHLSENYMNHISHLMELGDFYKFLQEFRGSFWVLGAHQDAPEEGLVYINVYAPGINKPETLLFRASSDKDLLTSIQISYSSPKSLD